MNVDKDIVEFILNAQASMLRCLGPDSPGEFRVEVEEGENINSFISIIKAVAEINGVKAYVSTNGDEAFDVLVKE